MKKIFLTQGKIALVDDADFEAVKAFKWYAQRDKSGRGIHAARALMKPNGKVSKQYLHQFLMPGIKRIDHRNGDGLDNQRHNLRPATHQQNLRAFQQKSKSATSKFRGVSWHKKSQHWYAQIGIGKKQTKYLGIFKTEEDAAQAYDVAARKYFGDFAQLNLTPCRDGGILST